MVSRNIEDRIHRLESIAPHAAGERYRMAELANRLERWSRGYLRRNRAVEPTEFPAMILADFLWEPDAAGTALAKYREGDETNLEGMILRLGRIIFETEQRAALHRAGWRDPRWQRSTA